VPPAAAVAGRWNSTTRSSMHQRWATVSGTLRVRNPAMVLARYRGAGRRELPAALHQHLLQFLDGL